MKNIRLSVPARDFAGTHINLNADHMKRLLENLPLANASECCSQITNLVYRLNRAPLDLRARMRSIELIQPSLEDITTSLRSSYINADLPLTEKRLQTAQIVRRLFTEMAYAHKIVVHDLFIGQRGVRNTPQNVAQAVYCAMSYLARLLVDNYALFSPEPKQLWLEINQLYLYAESQNFHQTPLTPVTWEQEPHPATIASTYKRVVLLALANPYHLMQGEAVKIFQHTKNWCIQCDIIRPAGNTLPEGKLFVDLAMDNPPTYAPNNQGTLKTNEGRLLEIKSLLHTLEDNVRHLTLESINSGQRSSLAKRMERDMYFRWSEALGLRRERMSHRKTLQAPAEFLCGLTATHHFLGGQRPFTPEEDEARLRGMNSTFDGGTTLSLVPEESSPWMEDHHIASGSARASNFGTIRDRDERAMWIRVYTTSEQMAHELIGDNDEQHDTYMCQLINVNQGGYALRCPKSTRSPARVGELLSVRSAIEPDSLAVCTVKWMKINDKQDVDMGLKIIADDARAIATKAVTGVGRGSEYYRALILPDLDPTRHPTTLITPAAVYDIGSTLQVLLSDQLLYLRLTRQIESTSTFSHYHFDIVEPPAKEKTRDQNQDDRYTKHLFR